MKAKENCGFKVNAMTHPMSWDMAVQPRLLLEYCVIPGLQGNLLLEPCPSDPATCFAFLTLKLLYDKSTYCDFRS